MKLKLYVIRDELTQDNSLLLTAKNDDELYRNIKAVMCSPDFNYFKDNPKDKRVVLTASIETTTGVITPEDQPILLKGLEEIRLELMDEANAAKSKVIENAIKNGITKDKANEFLNLFESLDFFGLETKKEKSYRIACEQLQAKVKELLDKIYEPIKEDGVEHVAKIN